MYENNVTYIFLLGFLNLYSFKYLLFLFLLIVYCVTICGNLIIITLVLVNKTLHSPMYFFITLISLLDIVMATTILPMLLHVVLNEGGFMSLTGCLSQLYVFANTEATECLILMVMSYDRYVAICDPLRYNSIINKRYCVNSVILFGTFSFLILLVNEISIQKLDFCEPYIIDNFFCDLPYIIKISCLDTFILQIQTILICSILIVGPFIMIIISYVYIITTILNIQAITGRNKVFATCSSHLTSVLIFYGSLISVYSVPAKGELLAGNKTLSLLYTVVTPLLNPFIYSLRNNDIKEAFNKSFKQLPALMRVFLSYFRNVVKSCEEA